MSNLTRMTIIEALEGLKKKEFTPTELTKAHIQEIEKTKELNAYVTTCFDRALDEAKIQDAAYLKGETGLMAGIPIAMKDLFCTENVRTTASSRILENFIPPYESTVSGKLKTEGAITLGKANLDEFAMGSSNLTSYYGGVINPWSPGERQADGSFKFSKKLVPGGSSGGSVAAVASYSAMAATGTDTGGSIRQPASFTGLVGVKPTYGRCSRWGVIAFASSLDQAGTLTRTVEDSALMLQAMCGFDSKDSTSVNKPVPNFRAALTGNIKGLRVGIPKEYRMEGMDPAIDAIWDKGIEWLKAAGAEIVPISLPHTEYALPTYYIIAPAEASSNLARYDGVRFGFRKDGKDLNEMYKNTRGEGFGPEVRRRIMIGTYVLSAGYYDAYYLKAQKVRARIAEDFTLAYQKCDVILTPSAPSVPFGFDEKNDDPIAMYLNDVFTVPASLAGLPCLSVPAGLGKDQLPLGLQLIGRLFDEETILCAAHVIEQAAQFNHKPAYVL
jgi:aspartyl-tRNA(Asn)/glutamyl-tRNA(Gln) amidotransferase subunit A